jgi:hypothetical protein
MSSNLEKFFNELKDQTAEQVTEYSQLDPKAALIAAFGSVAIELLVDGQVIPDCDFMPNIQTDGRNRTNFVSAFFNEEFQRLDVLTCIFVDEERTKTVPRDLIKRTVHEAVRGAKLFLSTDLESLPGTLVEHPQAQAIIENKSAIEYIQITVATNGTFSEWETSFDDDDSISMEIDVDVYDLVRLERLLDTKHSRENIEIDFTDEKLLGRPLDCLEMKPTQKEYGTYLAIFPGQLLYKLYEEFGAQLFEFNVRSFLSNRGKVNKGIRETIQKEPDRFMAYNNGLVATVDEIDVSYLDSQPRIFRMKGFQIVNGAQTTASIHRTAKQDKADLSQINVAVKITKVEEELLEEFVPLISKFANSQNNVQVADLSANHRFHIWFERLSRETWAPGQKSKWFYERARGSYEEELIREGTTSKKREEFKKIYPKAQKLLKTDLAKLYVGWQGRPFQVTTGAQKNFAKFMVEIDEITGGEGRTTEPSPPFFRATIAQKILQSAIQKICRTALTGYRSEVTNYTYATIAYVFEQEFDLDLIWENQSISEPLNQVLKELIPLVDGFIRDSAKGQNISEWCKKEDCWDLMIPKLDALDKGLYSFPERLTPESYAEHAEQGSEQSLESPFNYKDYSAAEWKKAAGWGLMNNTVPSRWAQITITISEYAAGSWMKTPSEKQLKFARPVMEKALASGVLQDVDATDEEKMSSDH